MQEVESADCEGCDECLRACEHASADLIGLLVTGAYFSNCVDHDKAWAHAVCLLANRIPYTSSAGGPAINLQHHVTLLAICAVASGAAAADRIDPPKPAYERRTAAGAPRRVPQSCWRPGVGHVSN